MLFEDGEYEKPYGMSSIFYTQVLLLDTRCSGSYPETVLKWVQCVSPVKIAGLINEYLKNNGWI